MPIHKKTVVENNEDIETIIGVEKKKRKKKQKNER